MRRFACFTLLCSSAPTTLAHIPFGNADQDRLPAILSGCLLALLWLAYSLGSWRQPPRRLQLFVFHWAMLLAVFSLLGPLDHWAEASAAWHMTQHMVMMVVIAPLWILARPWPQLAAAGLTPLWRLGMPALRLARYPLVAAWVHGGVIWFWHAPRFYVLALENEWWHVVEHACFLVSAGWFWWAVLLSSGAAVPRALLALLLTLMHTGFLGALLTFAHAPLYGAGRSLESQQLAGLLMWVLGGIPYLVAVAWVARRWFRQLTRRAAAARRMENERAGTPPYPGA